jgi:hypothetical protein
VISLNDTNQLNTLIELVEKFIFSAKLLLEKGIINQEVYMKMTEYKIKFLKAMK